MMTTRTKIIIVVVYTAVVAASGSYFTPTKVKTETKVVTVEKKVSDTDTKKKVRKIVVVHTIVKPDGEKDITSTTTDDTNTDTAKKTTDQASTETDKTKQTTQTAPKITISALGGYDFLRLTPVYGASFTRPFIGPVTFGAWGLSNLTFGLSAGLTF